MQNSNLDLIAHTSEEHKHCHLKNKFKGEQTNRVGLRLGWAFLKVAFSRKGEGDQFDSSLSPFIFQEELIQYQYNFIQLLNNLD